MAARNSWLIVIGQLFVCDELVEHLLLRSFEQIEMTLDHRIGQVIQQRLRPALVNFLEFRLEIREPRLGGDAHFFHARPKSRFSVHSPDPFP